MRGISCQQADEKLFLLFMFPDYEKGRNDISTHTPVTMLLSSQVESHPPSQNLICSALSRLDVCITLFVPTPQMNLRTSAQPDQTDEAEAQSRNDVPCYFLPCSFLLSSSNDRAKTNRTHENFARLLAILGRKCRSLLPSFPLSSARLRTQIQQDRHYSIC